MDSVLIGSVNSSQVVLEELIGCGCPPKMVYALDEQLAENVSGYAPIHKTAEEYGIPFCVFRKISAPEHIAELVNLAPDYIFVVGLSQLVDRRILSAAKKGVIGLHPAPLPRFRGRAALVWQVLLDIRESAITLFFIDEGMDSGPILGQEPFLIRKEDYAGDVEASCLEALRRLCRRVLPQLRDNQVQPVPQNEEDATYLLKRIPEDGLIDWSRPIDEIHRLVRAVSHPYPGAFSHYDGKQLVTIWRANIEKNCRYVGIPGQIAEVNDNSFSVVCNDGLLRVTEYSSNEPLRLIVGHKLRNKGDIR